MARKIALDVCVIVEYMNIQLCSDTSCGKTLEMQEVMPLAQYFTSSKKEGKRDEYVALYGSKAWCAHPSDTNPFVMVSV